MKDFQNKRITVAGLGRFGGGIEVTRWLAAQGRVLVTDREPAEKLADSMRLLDGLPIEFHLGGHDTSDFTNCDLVVTSPAIPPTNAYLQAARDAGIPITTEIRLFVDRCPAPVVGVTATKGKSTTSALVGAMLKTRYSVHVGGNIGGSLLSRLPEIRPDHLVVLELSSYMLEHLGSQQWSPHVGIVGMIGIDHVEWHGSAEAYVNAKRNLVRYMKPDDIAVLSEENEGSASFARHEGKGRSIRVKRPQAVRVGAKGFAQPAERAGGVCRGAGVGRGLGRRAAGRAGFPGVAAPASGGARSGWGAVGKRFDRDHSRGGGGGDAVLSSGNGDPDRRRI